MTVIDERSTIFYSDAVALDAVAEGFCFHCDRPVEIEYQTLYVGTVPPPSTCRSCGGHDVEFMTRAIRYLYRRWREALREDFDAILSEILEKYRGAWEKLARM